MPTKRKAISKKTRFEVFKRDGFKCQYCGAAAPDVLLEVDHIQPVSKGGDNTILNYVTACKPCNAGKSDRELSDDSAVKKQHSQLVELQERRDQLEMMLQWRSGLKGIQESQTDAIASAWSAKAIGWSLNEKGLAEARLLLKRFSLTAILDAIDTAGDSYLTIVEGKATAESVSLGWSKVGGICALNAMPDEERKLYYIRAILNNRLRYVPYDALDQLRDAIKAGCPLELMEREAKKTSSWSRYVAYLGV